MKQPLILTEVDKELFNSISIDNLNIMIGKDRIAQSNAGLFNQIIGYFKYKKKDLLFVAWMYEKYNLDKALDLPINTINSWEDELRIKQKSMIYIEILRVMFKPNSIIEFYAVQENNMLEYITSTAKLLFYSDIIRYLQFNSSVNKVYAQQGIEHALDKSDHVIRSDIKSALRHKLIPVVHDMRILSNSPEFYSLAYYDLECGDVNVATPAWDSFVSSLPDDGSRECFMAWVYSGFHAENFGRQVLYLFGRGNTGKSIVARAISNRLTRINSRISSALPPMNNVDKFSTSAFVNKRLLIAPDCIDKAIVRKQLIKNITGNDDIAIRRMHQEEKTENVYSKVLVTSNSRPFVNTEKEEELSRILYIEIDSDLSRANYKAWDSKVMGDWSSAIAMEIDDFVAKCKDTYYSCLQPDGHNIIPYDGMAENIEQGEYFIKRDLKIWWKHCIEPYAGEKNTNVILVSNLKKSYDKFCHPQNKNGKYDRSIRRFLMTLLRELGVDIFDFGMNNDVFIKGYAFVKDAPTMADLAKDRAGEFEESNAEMTPIFGRF